MTKQQIFVLAFTFAIGLFSGFYVYVTGFAPNYNNEIPVDENVLDNSFAIRAEQEGVCGMAGVVCPSFELLSNRKYRYIGAHSLTEPTPEPVTGYIPRAEFDKLKNMVKKLDLLELQKPGPYCQTTDNGIGYRYNVILDGIAYELNSCGTRFYNTPLYKELLDLWEMMAIENVEAELSFSLRALLIDWFPRTE